MCNLVCVFSLFNGVERFSDSPFASLSSQHYCLEPDDKEAKEPPKLLHSCSPHLDRVTHLETCMHGEKLLLLSASSDCSVALSFLPGDTIGRFGQVHSCTHTQII